MWVLRAKRLFSLSEREPTLRNGFFCPQHTIFACETSSWSLSTRFFRVQRLPLALSTRYAKLFRVLNPLSTRFAKLFRVPDPLSTRFAKLFRVLNPLSTRFARKNYVRRAKEDVSHRKIVFGGQKKAFRKNGGKKRGRFDGDQNGLRGVGKGFTAFTWRPGIRAGWSRRVFRSGTGETPHGFALPPAECVLWTPATPRRG